jgi:hypothetical protein
VSTAVTEEVGLEELGEDLSESTRKRRAWVRESQQQGVGQYMNIHKYISKHIHIQTYNKYK